MISHLAGDVAHSIDAHAAHLEVLMAREACHDVRHHVWQVPVEA
jgi:hypothetical protein